MKPSFLYFCLAICIFSHSAGLAECAGKPLMPNTRYAEEANSQGAMVRDLISGLIWMRCVVGMQWEARSKTCTGSAVTFTWDSAKSHVANLPKNASFQLKLPTHFQLVSLIDSSCKSPSINTLWFPGTPSAFTWSEITYQPANDYSWGVDFSRGELSYETKNSAHHVRLIKTN